jgi:methionine synthase I (cobalamin-dependent)
MKVNFAYSGKSYEVIFKITADASKSNMILIPKTLKDSSLIETLKNIMGINAVIDVIQNHIKSATKLPISYRSDKNGSLIFGIDIYSIIDKLK